MMLREQTRWAQPFSDGTQLSTSPLSEKGGLSVQHFLLSTSVERGPERARRKRTSTQFALA